MNVSFRFFLFFLRRNLKLMKKILFAFACLPLFVSCVDMFWNDGFGKMRSRTMGSGRIGGSDAGSTEQEQTEGGSESSGKIVKTDTVLLVCGVQVPPGYDWQIDTAIGLANGKVVLYRDMKEVLSIPTGYGECVSTDPDTHHLIGGHLYTEFSTTDHTVIKRDGEPLVEYEGREYLNGLLERGGDIYTLSSRRSGSGFTCRKNGEIIFDSPGGFIFGSFQESTYPETGALYEDSGKLCFSYKEYRWGSSACVYRDGRRSMVLAEDNVNLQDVRMHDGDIIAVGINPSGHARLVIGDCSSTLECGGFWESCRLLCTGSEIYVAGNVSDSSGIRERSVIMSADGVLREEKIREHRAFCYGSKVWLEPIEYSGYYCLSRGCLYSFAGDWYKALTPKNGCCPILMKNGEMREIEMNGYLTGVEVAVIPSS